MGIINYAAEKQLLVTARGHPYERDAFSALFDPLEDYCWSLVEQPAARYLFNPAMKERFDACVCYDMPGVDFTAEDPPGLIEPPEEFKQGFLDLLEAGMGFVFMHHSIAAWPAWEEYAEIVGGRFHYRPAMLRGQQWPDSGYRHQVDHEVSVLAEHPVTEGVPDSFRITDELYLCPVFEDSVIALLQSSYDFKEENFYSARRAVEGELNSQENWSHPQGQKLVGWIKSYANSPIVYLQGGDDPVAYENPNFQRLLHNAIRWVGSEEAHLWARVRHQQQAQQQ
jgi:type 1 glutamine amidotransferase